MAIVSPKQAIIEQTVRELGGELFDLFFDGVAEQQQDELAKYIGGTMELRDRLADFIFRWEAECERLREEEKRKAGFRRKIENFLGGLRTSIALQMESWQDQETQQVTVLKRITGHSSMFILKEAKATVEIEDVTQIPEVYLRYEPMPDKAAIGAALTEGKSVPGARLIPGKYYVEIR